MTDQLAKFTVEEHLGAPLLDRWVAGRETVKEFTSLLDAGNYARETYAAHKASYKGRSERKACYNVVVHCDGNVFLVYDHKGSHADAAARKRYAHHGVFA